MTDEQKKMLTEEVLGECWHVIEESGDVYLCSKCGKSRATIFMEGGRCTDNRTFNNDTDMMALYRAIYKNGEWNDFFDWAYQEYWKENSGTHRKFTTWLFCLDGEGYEDRCFLVSEWLEVKK